MRKKIYKWHRTLSIVIALPVLLWAISGFMHPFMTTIRPSVGKQHIPASAIDTTSLLISLQECLTAHSIDSFSNVHVIRIRGDQFYQVINAHGEILYFNTVTGRQLADGDMAYARYLSENMLGDSSVPVLNTELVTQFDNEYKFINRLLPVYRVSFNRADGIRIYVETSSGKMSYAVDNRRAGFDTFFRWFHSWEWMDEMGKAKYLVMVAIIGAAFLTTLMGLYIFFVTRSKKAMNPKMKARRTHRYTALAASLFTLAFTFSGGYHVLKKLLSATEVTDHLHTAFASSALPSDWLSFAYESIQQVSLVSMNDRLYCRALLMAKDQRVVYKDLVEGTISPDGDRQYAIYLAGLLSGNEAAKVQSAELITQFSGEYGFINKRLPVWRVSYGDERYYVETSSGVLAARISNSDLAEGYSFAFLHKHHFMDWAGKEARDISTMFWAAMQILMVGAGVYLYFRR